FENLSSDQGPADLAGPRPDLVQLGVAQQPAGWKVVDVAVAAQALDGLEGDLGGPLGGEQDGASGVLAGGFALVAGAGHRIDVSPGGIEPDIHVGKLGLHELE